MAKGDDIQERLVRLGVKVMDLCDELPSTIAGKHIAGQLLRSGTSGAPNYAEARGAESSRDFVHKRGIVLKELNEAEVCLPAWRNSTGQAGIDTLVRRKMADGQPILQIQQECKSLCRIIAASMRTANRNMGKTKAQETPEPGG